MERPASVVRALALLWALVLVMTVMTVFAVVFTDDLVAATGMGGARGADDVRVSPSFTPVVVTMVICLGLTTLIFMAFLKGGHNWARHCLAALLVSAAIATLAALRTGPPPLFVTGAIVMLLIEAAIMVFLYHPDTGRYVAVSRRRPHSESTTS